MKRGILLLSVFCLLCACKSAKETSDKQPAENEAGDQVLTTLLETYRNGEILQCDLKGEKVYRCQKNVYDGGSRIFDENGEKICDCLYSTGIFPDECNLTFECKALYRVKGNIWGEPAVNKIETQSD